MFCFVEKLFSFVGRDNTIFSLCTYLFARSVCCMVSLKKYHVDSNVYVRVRIKHCRKRDTNPVRFNNNIITFSVNSPRVPIFAPIEIIIIRIIINVNNITTSTMVQCLADNIVSSLLYRCYLVVVGDESDSDLNTATYSVARVRLSGRPAGESTRTGGSSARVFGRRAVCWGDGGQTAWRLL